MTTWNCNRCGNEIIFRNKNCPKCRKILYWISNGSWLFESYFPKGINPMTKEESNILKEKWNNQLKENYKAEGKISYWKFLIFGEGNTADRRRRRATTEEMAEVFRKGGHSCVKCDTEHELTVDHIIPLAKGGTWDIDNLQPMCHSCNSSKGVKV